MGNGNDNATIKNLIDGVTKCKPAARAARTYEKFRAVLSGYAESK